MSINGNTEKIFRDDERQENDEKPLDVALLLE